MISEGHPFPIDSIIINRSERVRKEVTFSSIENLKGSIARLGLINPITITREGVLVAGETRLMACRALGWDKISVRFTDELSPSELRIIELEENTKRTDLDWRDKIRAVKELHETFRAGDPAWTQAKTADYIGYGEKEFNQVLRVEQNLSNEYIAKQPNYSTARNAVLRKDARAAADQAQVLMEPEAEDLPVLNEDFIKWAKSYSGPKFNFIHCDFPYGIGRDKSAQGGQATAEVGGYEDSIETYKNLLDALSCGTFIGESCHIVFWFPMVYYDITMHSLMQSEWAIDPYPLVWLRSDNSGILPDSNRGTRRIYETAFFGYRGDRKVIKAVGNAFPCASEKDGHASVKPETMLKHFFQMIVDENTRMLDPTCGSGSSIKACEAAGGKALGLEINENFAKRANFAIMQAREGRRK